MNPLDRLKKDKNIRDTTQAALEHQRATAVKELLEDGWTYRSLAAELGVSPARVHQWAHQVKEA